MRVTATHSVSACAYLLVGLFCFGSGAAQAAELELLAANVTAPSDLVDLTLEELMGIEVYSVAKKRQKPSESAAAVYILTSEDIRRSGATSVPELLRLVPGMEVAHIDANIWAITARGFNDRFANKLLVLIDGRSAYTPLFAGVYWDAQDTALEDIERIEVIRGPGGTLWGANAVNGVINIITKSAKDTQGVLVSGGGGTHEEAFGMIRSGVALSPNAFARVYMKYDERNSYVPPSGGNGWDDWDTGRAGFRIDWDPSSDDEITLSGETYRGQRTNRAVDPQVESPYLSIIDQEVNVSGGHVLGRWRRNLTGDSSYDLKAYYDRTSRRDPGFREDRDTFDIDFQHRMQPAANHDLIWGLSYRFTYDDARGDFVLSWDPDNRGIHLFSGYIQDEISLLSDDVRVTLGTKVEHNDYTGVEVQPSARVVWKATPSHTLWSAVSRAVRTPSRSEDDITIASTVAPPGDPRFPDTGLPTVATLVGSRDYESEELLAFEAGWRVSPSESLAIDIAAYYNDYDNLRTAIPDPSAFSCGSASCELPSVATNQMEGKAYGVEVAADVILTPKWRMRAGYNFIELDLELDASAASDPFSERAEDASPPNQFFVRSMTDLPFNLEGDATVRWVDRIRSPGIDSYVTADARLAWTPSPNWEIALVGQNLLDRERLEYGSSALQATLPSRVPRGFYGKITWRP